MNYTASYYSSQGGRNRNEDSVKLYSNDNSIVAIICDGLGGMDDGDIASSLAADRICIECRDSMLSPIALENAIGAANLQVYEQTHISNMRTTAAVIWINGEDAMFANVGDTRIYHFRDGQIIFQSKDHSVAWLSYLRGDISLQEVRGNCDRNKLIRALGNADEVKVDITPSHIRSNDAFLICSDGFWESIMEDEMISLLEHSETVEEWLRKMRDIVESRTSVHGDNHSAIVLRAQ